MLTFAVLCVLLLATVGTTAAVAKQMGNSPTYQFTVAITNPDGTTGSGKLVVDTSTQTDVFNRKGLTPGTMYHLYTPLDTKPLGSDVANAGGNVHLRGTCTEPQTL